MPKPPNLQTALQKASKQPERGKKATDEATPRGRHYRPGRAKTVNVTGYFSIEVKRQLRRMAADDDTTIQKLLGEALNDLFAKYGRPELVASPPKK